MSREIKFRGMTENGKWVYGSYDSKYFEVIGNIHERSAESEQ